MRSRKRILRAENINHSYDINRIFKSNESRHIILFAISGSTKKIFSIHYVNIYIFSIFFSIDFARWQNLGLPQIVYIAIH